MTTSDLSTIRAQLDTIIMALEALSQFVDDGGKIFLDVAKKNAWQCLAMVTKEIGK